jgi:DNA-binding transcriptional LysR family regulator
MRASWFETRRHAPHHEEDRIYRHNQMAACFAVAKIRWHRAFVQCIVLNTSISYLDVSMDMDQIRTFVAVARGRSFSGAAATWHRSQPAISRRIELLEREFDIALFERLRGGSILTDAGAAFPPYPEIVLAAAADGAETLRAGRQGETGKIPLALVGKLANAALTNTLRQFEKQYPEVRLATRQRHAGLPPRLDDDLGVTLRIGEIRERAGNPVDADRRGHQ